LEQELIGMDSGNTNTSLAIIFFALLASPALHAGWNDWYQKLEGALPEGIPGEKETLTLSQSEIVAGLKEALDVGVRRATDELGKAGGFLDNKAVKIPMPASLQKVEQGLRFAGQDALADDFIVSMNRAAERAVPATTTILADTIKNMSIDDARGILNGPDDAATEYFRQHNENQLATAILPIIEDTTAQTGVTSAYKKMTANLGLLSQFTDHSNLDLDRYITQKTMDGLFLKLAQEEKLIREDPVARSTELLKKVFADSP
jgi:hypothetical protein